LSGQSDHIELQPVVPRESGVPRNRRATGWAQACPTQNVGGYWAAFAGDDVAVIPSEQNRL
jgi:hypothetical protein